MEQSAYIGTWGWWNFVQVRMLHRVKLGSANPVFFFKNEEIFVQLEELEEFYKITHALIGFNYSLTEARKTFWCNG